MNLRSRRLIQAFVILLILGGAGILLIGRRSSGEDFSEVLPKPVRTARPERRDIKESVEAWGNLESANQVSILPRVSGAVTEVFFDVGEKVSSGDILAEIDREVYLLDLRRVEAMQAAASSTWERVDRLYASGNATRQDWENARAAHLTAEAQASAARLRYDWTRVAVPISGVVLVRHATTGDMVSPEAGTPLYTVGSLGELELELRLPESYYPGFAGEVLPDVEFIADAFPDLNLDGAIETVSPWVDPTSRTFAVVCRVHSDAGILRPGMLAGARFITELRKNVLTLPDSALTGSDGFWSLGNNGRARFRTAVSSVLSEDYVIVPESWAGETFIIEGQHFLSEGDLCRDIDQ